MKTSAIEVESPLVRPAAAGFAYAILAFGVGFALGTIRVLIVVPRVGPTAAVLLETPAILGASWWVSRICVARFEVSRAVSARLTTASGAIGLAAQVAFAGFPVVQAGLERPTRGRRPDAEP